MDPILASISVQTSPLKVRLKITSPPLPVEIPRHSSAPTRYAGIFCLSSDAADFDWFGAAKHKFRRSSWLIKWWTFLSQVSEAWATRLWWTQTFDSGEYNLSVNLLQWTKKQICEVCCHLTQTAFFKFHCSSVFVSILVKFVGSLSLTQYDFLDNENSIGE